MTTALFKAGQFKLHSGQLTGWKVDCDGLSADSLRALAQMALPMVGPYGSVVSVPRGGDKLAAFMEQHIDWGHPAILIVDDVMTTGASMMQAREAIRAANRIGEFQVKGLVVFSRNKGGAMDWVVSLFHCNEELMYT